MLGLERFLTFADSAVSGGYIVALATVCLLQYILSVVQTAKERERWSWSLDRCSDLERQVDDLRRDRLRTRLENGILRELVASDTLEAALDIVFRRFIPSPQSGFAAFFVDGIDGMKVHSSRGLKSENTDRLRLDDGWQRKLEEEPILTIDGRELFNSKFLAELSGTNRRKASRLFVLGIREGESLLGVLVTTALYPASADIQQQREVALRVLDILHRLFKHSDDIESHQTQLHLSQEMLALTAIADHDHESPSKMIEAFFGHLTESVQACRGTLYLANREDSGPGTVLLRTGVDLQSGIERRWFEHEDMLAQAFSRLDRPEVFEADDLRRIGIDTLMGSALVVPLLRQGRTIGCACFTKRDFSGFSETRRSLVDWAAGYLTDSIFRALNQAAIERQARQDGLTELANRRAFDEQLAREVATARTNKRPCTLLLCDLDRFKSINDVHGHQAGDEVLKVVAARLRNEVAGMRATDRALVARYGGEEMAILLPGVTTEGASRIAESVRAAVEHPAISVGNTMLEVTTSVGLATFPLHAANEQELVAAADTALYQAKESGRNQVCVAHEAPAAC